MGILCFCAQAQQEVDKSEIYLAISNLEIIYLIAMTLDNNILHHICYSFPTIVNEHFNLIQNLVNFFFLREIRQINM